MIRKELDHVGLNVADLEKSIAFYQELFGFSVIEKWDSPKQAFIGADGVVLGLMEMPNYDYRTYTMAHLAFPCDKSEFSNVVIKIQGLGLEIVSGPKEQRGGETILFRDPSGNILEVCYPPIAEWKALQT
ncbi:MAG: VOC family protein [Methylobacter sp.]